jgi:hypothetical protein
MSKKGMEMSINIVVGMVLGIAMLVAGILLFNRIVISGDKVQVLVDERTKDMMQKVLDTGEPIYVPVSNINVERKHANFWIGVRNIENKAYPFTISVIEKDGPTTDVADFNDDDRIAYIETPQIIDAKGNGYWNIVVDMKGITETVTLLIKVNVDRNGEVSQWSTTKVVYIKP